MYENLQFLNPLLGAVNMGFHFVQALFHCYLDISIFGIESALTLLMWAVNGPTCCFKRLAILSKVTNSCLWGANGPSGGHVGTNSSFASVWRTNFTPCTCRFVVLQFAYGPMGLPNWEVEKTTWQTGLVEPIRSDP